MAFHILVADDEAEIIEFLRLYLEKDGYQVFAAPNGVEALRILEDLHIDLAVIDIMMPEMNGYTLIKNIREKHNIPVIFLSAKGESADKILGLGLGADDYVEKPFDPLELTARIDAQLRRFYKLGANEKAEEAYLTVRDMRLDMKQCILYKGDIPISLTSIEFKILKLLMSSPGRVYTKKQIYETAWEDSYIVDDNNIMVYISKLREKLGEREGESYIKTIRGLGYKMLP